jgi:undecaprenyl-diphosphatase
METIHVVVLAVVQGLTEFLPISSDGHLVVAEEILGVEKDGAARLAVNVLLHAGTLLAVLVVYWRRIGRLLGEDAALIGKLLVGTLPAAVIGLALKYGAPELVGNTLLAGLMLMVTGGLLLWGSRQPLGELAYQQVTYGQALLIGTAQGLAVLPGLSRSGSTIVAGLAVGLRRDAAATFSFLLAIPAISGAVALETVDLVREERATLSLGPLLLGVLIAFVIGLVALRWLLKWLEQGRLHQFAWWCIPLGAAVALWQLLK